jgi:pantoate--beta-alanine ligase
MEVYKTIEPLIQFLDTQRGLGLSIGFVPTMGALHQGHVSLIKESVRKDDITVVSIFVNPNQFNNPDDLKRYPRNPEKDIEICEKAGASFVFLPSVEVVYPEPDTRIFDFGLLDKVMEGKHRPGHFNGVAQVVSRLFNIIKPTRAYFGQKDFQQLAIIKRMVKDYKIDVEIIAHPTVREEDGLAMSSRNALLTPKQRASAPLIAKTLFDARNKVNVNSVKDVLTWVEKTINNDPLLRVEYFSIVNAETLEEIEQWNDTNQVVGCIAVNVGLVRLIDNILFKP